jgi:uncharacterized protein with von Willebrand factor type A (vWA) domain
MTAGAADELIVWLAGFGRTLRASGMDAGPSRLLTARDALGVIDLGDSEQVRWALRCALVAGPEDGQIFDAAFAALWAPVPDVSRSRSGAGDAGAPGDGPRAPAPARDAASGSSAGGAPGPQAVTTGAEEATGPSPDEGAGGAAWSAQERLQQLDFKDYGEEELRQARRLLERTGRRVPERRSLRLEPSRRGPQLDPRRTVRAALSRGGDPVERRWRRHRQVPRRVIFLLDVSGSMEPYARGVVMFVQAWMAGGRQVEAFTFGTRLTRLTRHLTGGHGGRALASASRAVPDWAGGTRIGESLKEFNDAWGRRGLTRGAIVVIVSDGWERGDTALLAEAMERLQRAAHTLVWVNPLSGDPEYEPLAAGMAAALPFVDVFFPGHNLRSLEALAGALAEISRPGAQRPARARARPRLQSI